MTTLDSNFAIAPTQASLVTHRLRSKDGAAIAYERVGLGPPVILVDGALCSVFASVVVGHLDSLQPR